jgi:hypothetical protein
MKCYNHPDRDAVGQCSQCQKGVCSECAHDVGGATLCPTDFNVGVAKTITHARRRVIGAWIFTGILGSLFAIEAVVFSFIPPSSGSQPLGLAGLLLVPVAYFGSWSLFWGWGPTWSTFRRLVGGWGCFGSGIFILIVVALIFELLLFIALAVGAFTGIQRYLEDRRVLARAPALLARIP